MPNFLINIMTKGAGKANAGVKRLSSSLMSLSKVAMVGAGAGAVAMGVAFKKATDAAGQQELMEKKLAQALGKSTDALLKQAGALQQTSTFGDEAIIQQQAYLASIGMTEQQIQEMIPVTMDLAAATGMSLESAVKNTAKTLSGMTGELGESVGSLKDLTAEELKAGKGIEVMREMFKGAAEAEVKTFSGAMSQAKNAIGDAAESLGNLLLPMAKDGAGIIKKFSEDLSKGFDFIGTIDFKETGKNILNNLGAIGQALVDTLKAYWSFLPELFRAALDRILPIAKKIFDSLINGIINVGKFIFEPIVMAGKMMGVKIANFFIEAVNKIKSLYNAMASFLGMNKLEMTPTISEEGLSMANTRMGEFVTEMANNEINTAEDLKNRISEIRTNLANTLIATNETIKESDDSRISSKEKGVSAEEKLLKRESDARKKNLETIIQGTATVQDEIRKQIKARFASMVAGLLEKVIGTKGLFGLALAPIAAAGASQIFEKLVPSFAQGGDFVTNGEQLIRVGDNPSGRERVQITPLGGDPAPNAPASSLVVNVSGNVLTDDFVENNLSESIREAVRRGVSFGF